MMLAIVWLPRPCNVGYLISTQMTGKRAPACKALMSPNADYFSSINHVCHLTACTPLTTTSLFDCMEVARIVSFVPRVAITSLRPAAPGLHRPRRQCERQPTAGCMHCAYVTHAGRHIITAVNTSLTCCMALREMALMDGWVLNNIPR